MSNYELEEKTFYYDITYSKKSRISKKQILKQLPNFNNDDNLEFLFVHENAENDRALSNKIFELIDLAIKNDSHILVSSFYISNFTIIDALIKASKKLKGKVYILVGDEYHLNDSIKDNGSLSSIGLIDLAKNGAQIRKKDGAHLKFILSSKKAIIMSTNLSTAGLLENPEYGFVIEKENQIYDHLRFIFSSLWHKRSETMLVENGWIDAPNWSIYNEYPTKIKNMDSKIIVSSIDLISEMNSKNEIINPNTLLSVILDLLNRANKTIDISIYSFMENPGTQMNAIFEALISKANSTKVRILVPQVKLRHKRAQKMLNTLFKLENHGIKIRYYKELHGKIIIIDKKEALFFTSNFDEYIENIDTFDIGYAITKKPLVNNILKFYNHLWTEASEQIEPVNSIKLRINLLIESQNYLSSKRYISVLNLENKIKESSSIKFFYSENKSLLEIIDKNNDNYSVEILHTSDSVYDKEFLLIKGVINQIRRKFNKKNSEEFIISSLRLNLYWEDLV